VSDGTVNVVVPRITCTLTVEDPTLDMPINPPALHVSAFGHTQCDFQVLHLRQYHQLIWLRTGEIVPRVADAEGVISSDNKNAGTLPNYPCDEGRWTSTAEDLVLWPPGYTPRVSIIIAPNPDPLYVVKRDCLGNHVGQPLKVAEAAIQDEGFTVGTVTMQPSDTAPYDNVLAQNLESDDQTVDLVVSEGNHTVPDLLGDEQAYGLSELDEDGLIRGTVTMRDDCISKGDVEDQTPGAGT